MNSITILGYIIPDAQIVSGSIALANSMICDELTADEAQFEINYTESARIPGNLYSNEDDQLYSNEGDALMGMLKQSAQLHPALIPYGTPITYSHDGNVIAKLYTTQIEQTGKYRWKITAQSAVGLLIHQEHNGGVYSVANGDTIKSVIDEIMEGLTIAYSVSDTIAEEYVAGWLPVGNCRDNLQQLCLAFGISILKDAYGDLLFQYNDPDSPEETITLDRLYIGGTKTLISPASKVTVYEHAYYAITSRAAITLYDNTSETVAINQKIVFDNPIIISTIATTGTITISESNQNYCIVSGSGTISAVEYTHTMRALSKDTGVSTVENKEIIYSEATLVNALNSENCLNRIAAFYTEANEISYDLVMDDERTGELINYPDPFTFAKRTGLIKSLDITLSHTLKARMLLTENWSPAYLGNNYTSYDLITDGDTWTSDVTGAVRIYLVSGGQGGYGGYKGSAGSEGYPGGDALGGAGGAGGEGGAGGIVAAYDVAVVAGVSYSISIGAGGVGGAENHGTGSAGGNTTITINGVTYTSANGTTPADGLVNTFTGNVYALTGDTGEAGAAGGRGGYAESGEDGAGYDGESLTINGITYSGGAGYYRGRKYSQGVGGGGGGSGAAAGSNGNGGGSPGSGVNFVEGGDGGTGASATLVPSTTAYLGYGGTGGYGGGGGGGGGNATGTADYIHGGNFWGDGQGGAGGQGGQGGQGFILIYKPAA